MRALGEYRGKQQLYVVQSPEVLSGLQQVAVVESTESSNRLEGIEVAPSRLKALVLKDAAPKSRSEQEVAGHRDALALIHESGEHMPFTEGKAVNLNAVTVVDDRTPAQIRQSIQDQGRIVAEALARLNALLASD